MLAYLLACWDFSPDKKLSVLLKKVHKVLQGVHNVNVNYLRKKSEERIFLLLTERNKKKHTKGNVHTGMIIYRFFGSFFICVDCPLSNQVYSTMENK